MSKISIVIPVYNVAKYLPRCVESVLDQSFKDLEIVLVNDGSTDRSLEIIHQYAMNDSRIIWVDKINGGLSDARNAGMQVTSGEYICFLDGDDWYDSDFVETMYLRMIKNDQCDLVCCNYRYVWLGGKSVEKAFLKGLPDILAGSEIMSAFLNQKVLGSVVIKMYRRSIIEEQHLIFPTGCLWEDLVFTQEYLFHCRQVEIIHRSLYNYFQGEVSLSRSSDTLNLLHFMDSAQVCVKKNEEQFPELFEKDNRCFVTRAFISIMLYSFKCKDKEIIRVYRKKLKEYESLTGFSLLLPKEKVMLVLYYLSYPFARQAYLNVFKRIA